MPEFMSRMLHDLEDFFYNPNYEEKVLIQSNFWVPALCFFYWVFTSYLGPYIMRNRKPYNLKYLIIFHNFSMVIFNFNIGWALVGYLIRLDTICPPDPKQLIRDALRVLKPHVWRLILVKHVELLDSVFFVLRKKFELLTVLHRLHHAMVPVLAVYFGRDVRGFCLYYAVSLNTMIHVVMYFYYGLAAFGPRLRKYLWWKKYLTAIQIVQFFSVLCCAVINASTGCYPVETPEVIMVFAALCMFILFINYYVHEAIRARQRRKQRLLEKNFQSSTGAESSLRKECHVT